MPRWGGGKGSFKGLAPLASRLGLAAGGNSRSTVMKTPRRHFIVPDTQIRPGVPTQHLDWVAHDEPYRDAQSNGEWRGVVCLNEVRDGTYDVMPLSMDYLSRKYS